MITTIPPIPAKTEIKCDGEWCATSVVVGENYINPPMPKGWERIVIRNRIYDLCPGCADRVLEQLSPNRGTVMLAAVESGT